jgi:hypothetical protein
MCTGPSLVANRTTAWQVSSIHVVHPPEHSVGMAPTSIPQPRSFAAAAVHSLLATERDAHRRQRELVRASLMMCPGKSPRQPRTA